MRWVLTGSSKGRPPSPRWGDPVRTLQLDDPVAATTVEGEKGVRDEALSADGRFLYALDADAQRVFGWEVEDDGSLKPVGSFNGLPATVAGLASS